MSNEIIRVENVSKKYRLGEITSGTLSHDITAWWNRTVLRKNPAANYIEDNELGKVTAQQYVWSLKDVSFTVQPGEVLGIIGKNGAGKSTLLKLLSKITLPTGGTIKIDGRVSSLLEVGTGFHPDLSGRENIFLNGAMLGMRKHEIRNRFDEIVDFSGIEKYIDTPVKRYSSGMFVRLAFAVAAHLEPEILIIDEVLAVGDAEFQQKCIGKIQDVVTAKGRTILFVSHNNAAIKRLCTNALLLEKGKVKLIDTPERVLETYQLSNSDLEQGIRDTKNENTKGYFTKWHLTDTVHKIAEPFTVYTRSQARLTASFSACHHLGNCEFHVLILDENDSYILHANSKDFLLNSFSLNAGEALLTFDFSLPLRAGKYKVQMVLNSDNQQVDHWRTTTLLQVLDTFDRHNTTFQGILNVKTDFSFKQLETIVYPAAS